MPSELPVSNPQLAAQLSNATTVFYTVMEQQFAVLGTPADGGPYGNGYVWVADAPGGSEKLVPSWAKAVDDVDGVFVTSNATLTAAIVKASEASASANAAAASASLSGTYSANANSAMTAAQVAKSQAEANAVIATDRASNSTVQAGLSKASADNANAALVGANTARTQAQANAVIATANAVIATTQAGLAQTSSNNANTAMTAAQVAKGQAEANAVIANANAVIATTQAGLSQTSANNSNVAMTAAQVAKGQAEANAVAAAASAVRANSNAVAAAGSATSASNALDATYVARDQAQANAVIAAANAVIATTQAGLSQTSANNSNVALTAAQLARTQAQANATAAAGSAGAAAGSSTTANTAMTAAQLAMTQAQANAVIATDRAANATTQAGISTTQAGVSTTKATQAAQSASDAANSAASASQIVTNGSAILADIAGRGAVGVANSTSIPDRAAADTRYVQSGTGTLPDARLSTNVPLKNANNSFNGNNSFTGTQTLYLGTATTVGTYLQLSPTDYGTGKPLLFIQKDATATRWNIGIYDGTTSTGTLNLTSQFLTHNGSTVWTQANDGAGSGLDADTLDGFGTSTTGGASTVAVRDSNGDITGRIFASSPGFGLMMSGLANPRLFGPTSGSPTWTVRSDGATTGQLLLQRQDGTNIGSLYSDGSSVGLLNPASGWALRAEAAQLIFNQSGTERQVYHTGNLAAASSASSASTLVQRDSNGDIFGRYAHFQYFEQSSPNNENPTVTQVMIQNGSDSYIRKASIPHFVQQAINGAAGTVTITEATTMTPDFGAGVNFAISNITGPRTLANPINAKVGQTGFIIMPNGSGVGTMSFGTAWQFQGGAVPTLTLINGRKDILYYQVLAPGVIYASLIKDVR